MDLIRGKTFIKTYAQHPPEKIPTVAYKGKKNVDLGKNFKDCEIRGKTFVKSYTQNPPEKVPTVTYKVKKNVEPPKNLECDNKKNEVQTQRMSNGIGTKEVDSSRCPRFIRKSKTHDCVILRDDKPEKVTGHVSQSQIPHSHSSQGFVEDQGGRRSNIEANKHIQSKQNMIDYRNFVPQMPFVPSVAKSLPRKRISLRKSKKSLKSIFNLRKNKQQDVISEDENQPMVFEMKGTNACGKQLSIGEMSTDEFLLHDCLDRDMYIDTIDSLKALCEDVASLKSFDSLTGCGEIFADESASFIDLENSRVTFISKPNAIAASFQGGVERLASPAKSESIDFSRLRGHMNSSARNVCSNVLFETKRPFDPPNVQKVELGGSLSGDQVSNLSFSDLMSSNENIQDADSPMSTSDEGYYDSYSPVVEEDKNEVSHSRPFPRDSYSGDALYELFSDSCEKKLWPAQDSDLPAPGKNSENPTSIHSFCVASEENMASQPAPGLDREEGIESTWKGRECLLKLCDTELSLTIGMVNWLKKTGNMSENDLDDENISCHMEQMTGVRNNKGNEVGDGKGETFLYSESVKTEHTDYVNGKEGNTDNGSNTNSTLDSDGSKNNPPFETQMVLYDPSSKQNNINDKIEYPNHLKSSSPWANALSPVALTQIPNVMNVPLLVNHLGSLRPLEFQCLTYDMPKNNKWLLDILEWCTTDVPPMQVLFGNECGWYHLGKIMRPYEIAQNIKNSMEKPGSSKSTTDNEENKINQKTDTYESPWASTICRKNCDHNYVSNQQFLGKKTELLPTETQPFKDVGKPGFLPLFKSTCSSVISRCSSVLYKVHNPEDAIIFFGTKKYNSTNSNDELTQSASIDCDKYTEDGFLSITSRAFTRESGLLITKNKKWSI
ncbi:hypothetical protein GDO81_007358 [Engystomops pustulosus]|uniref:Uncharacterized protein n=1 Tax=Engystomops pustulosus TaxID=76066 RepID=A0AAV6YVS9_ENGPU|nr:hypothetical protein GDO81_029127 [Engystomops pustulosus]KAG8580597.1 hypothetical protein GDO81_007358 [Engystomops pustulosus]